jgi:hypothetical protein
MMVVESTTSEQWGEKEARWRGLGGGPLHPSLSQHVDLLVAHFNSLFLIKISEA